MPLEAQLAVQRPPPLQRRLLPSPRPPTPERELVSDIPHRQCRVIEHKTLTLNGIGTTTPPASRWQMPSPSPARVRSTRTINITLSSTENARSPGPLSAAGRPHQQRQRGRTQLTSQSQAQTPTTSTRARTFTRTWRATETRKLLAKIRRRRWRPSSRSSTRGAWRIC
jgi:hypothetical protein